MKIYVTGLGVVSGIGIGVSENIEALQQGKHGIGKQILENVFDLEGDFVDENTIAVNIRRLREKIEDNPAAPVYIKNIRGLGYIWNQEVRQ